MQFQRTFMVELPFMLNIPAGEYEVSVGADKHTFAVIQDQWAIPTKAEGQLSYLFVPTSALTGLQSGATPVPLRTVVCETETTEVAAGDVISPTEDQLAEEFSQRLIRSRTTTKTGADLLDEAKEMMKALNEAELEQLTTLTSLKLTARSLFPTGASEDFLKALNTFIRIYMAHFTDFFVEEVTLHQLGSTTTQGILNVFSCDNSQFDAVSVCGKIPPIMRKPWLNHPAAKVTEFKTRLQSGADPDSLELLAVRAMGLLERGAHRSAIIEASAALETAVARRIKKDMMAAGTSEQDADDFLHQNQRFSDRAKSILKDKSGFSAPEIGNALWERIVNHRDTYRHKISHSDAEPPKAEAQAAVNDFVSLARSVRDHA